MADEQKGGQGEEKLHVDSHWKAEVQAERERLAREERERRAADEANRRKREAGILGAERAEAEGEEAGEMPPASFESLVQTLAAQALMFLTPERDPKTGRPLQNLELAKHSIDLLAVLEEKTKGNLSEREKSLLDTMLYQTRMAYVEASRIV